MIAETDTAPDVTETGMIMAVKKEGTRPRDSRLRRGSEVSVLSAKG
jgi:hypothetical protein